MGLAQGDPVESLQGGGPRPALQPIADRIQSRDTAVPHGYANPDMLNFIRKRLIRGFSTSMEGFLGWYEGFHLLMAMTPAGVITGSVIAPASAKDQPMTETFLALRHRQVARLPTVGAPARGPYVTDAGFEGQANH